MEHPIHTPLVYIYLSSYIVLLTAGCRRHIGAYFKNLDVRGSSERANRMKRERNMSLHTRHITCYLKHSFCN